MNSPQFSRRQAIQLLGGLGLGLLSPGHLFSKTFTDSIMTRSIPSSGEALPIVGLGTWRTFDVGSNSEGRKRLTEVLKNMQEKGGKVIDSSPMYGSSETVVGDLTAKSGHADHFFYATKVWTQGKQAGIDQMNDSMRKMKRNKMDLMQIHNLVDWKTHLKTLLDWKEQGKIRYIGITHYTIPSHSKLEEIVKSEPIDFVQVNFSINVRNAENRLLPTARDKGVAVIINRPYEGGALFNLVKGKQLPDWAADYGIKSWGQYFLKYIVSNPAVTCAIPGTSNPDHLVDNMGAGYGRLPDEKTRQRMVAFLGL